MPHPINQILTRCAKSLYDETNDEYTLAELLMHLNSSVNEIVQFDTKAFMLNQPFACVGGTLQTLTGDAVAIVDVRYNCDVTGLVQGRVITECDMENLELARPGWHQSPASMVTRHFTADPRDPKRFYLWPPRPMATPGYVMAVWQSVPDDMNLEQVPTTDDSAVDQAILTMTDTYGILVGQTASDFAGAIPVGATVLSIVPNVSVTLGGTNNGILLDTIPSGTVITFCDLFSLPDLYEEAAYLFVLYHVLNREDKKGNPTKALQYQAMFLKAMDQDIKDITAIQAGHTRG